MDGSYPGGIITRGKSLTLRSANGRDATIIDCERGGRGITVPNGGLSATVVQGLTVRNCSGERSGGVRTGGGLWSSSLTYVVVLDSRLEDNILGRGTPTTPTTGGGMLVGWRAHIARSEFLDNDADRGGGLYMGEITSGVLGWMRRPSRQRRTRGGGLYVDQASNGSTIVLRSTFDANTSGGGRTERRPGWAPISGRQDRHRGVHLQEQRLRRPGAGAGGRRVRHDGRHPIVNTVFVNNRAHAGGGLYYSGSNAGVANCTFYGNRRASPPGTVAAAST